MAKYQGGKEVTVMSPIYMVLVYNRQIVQLIEEEPASQDSHFRLEDR